MIWFYQFLAFGTMLLAMCLGEQFEPFLAAVFIIGAIMVNNKKGV